MKKIKMIGLDLDGTLLNSKKEVTDHTKSVLEEAIAQGIIVLVATPNSFFAFSQYSFALSLS